MARITYEGAAASINESLERLGTAYADLMLIHAPKPWAEIEAGSTRKYFKENLAVWKAMEEAYEAGKVRAIGVSVPQICIRYDLQLGTLPIPKTTDEAHMRQNAEVDFVISDADMERLKAVAPV